MTFLKKKIMPKLNKKQIENELRGKIAKQYTKRTMELEDEVKKLSEQLCEANQRVRKSEQEKLEMQDKLNQLEDWNQRLQEFMDMSEEERTTYLEHLKRTKKLDDTIELLGTYSKMFGTWF